MQPEPGVRLTVICTDVHTPYSGMLPGYVSGHYSYDEVHIDLARLAVFAGARLYRDEVVGIDRVNKKVLCRHRPPVPYDCLSINIGSTPSLSGVAGADDFATPVKPITRFKQRWLALLAKAQQHSQGLMRIAVVGAGAGGVELLLSMQYRLRNELTARGRNPELLQFHLLTAGSSILPTHNTRVRRKFASVLAGRGVEVHLNAEVTRRRRRRAGAGLCRQRLDRRTTGGRHAQGRHAARRRAHFDQADWHRHAVCRARPPGCQGALIRRTLSTTRVTRCCSTRKPRVACWPACLLIGLPIVWLR